MTDLNKIAKMAVDKLLNAGADKALARVSRSEKREFNMEAGSFTLLRTLFDNTLVLNAIIGGRRGVVAVNHLDEASLDGAVKEAMAVAQSAEPDAAWDFASEAPVQQAVQGAPEADMETFFARVRELAEDIRTRHAKIVVESMTASHIVSEEAFLNSYGVHHTSRAGKYEVDVMFSGHEGDKAGSFNSSGFVTDRLDMPFIDRASMEQDLFDAENQIHTIPLEGKFTGTAVFPSGCFGSMLYSILSNFTSARPMMDGTCIWKDKLGQMVADERFTLSMCPGDARVVCGERYTGEGFASEDYDVIKNGVLKSFTLDLYTANRTGQSRAKNSAWNMVVCPGDTKLEDIVSGIERGIIVGRFSGGEPGTNGDFSGVAKNSYLIENGKRTQALSETMISGNLAQMLMNLRALSSEVVEDGMNALPAAAFDGITISGK